MSGLEKLTVRSVFSREFTGVPAAAVDELPERSNVSYQPQFDSLRALAVLAVMSDHFAADIPDFPVPDSVHLGRLPFGCSWC